MLLYIIKQTSVHPVLTSLGNIQLHGLNSSYSHFSGKVCLEHQIIVT